MFRDGYVLAILKDENGKTIGAKIRLDNKVLGYTSNEISQLKRKGLQLINAVITSDGFVRAREGKLPVEIFNTKPTIIEQRDISNANKLLNSNIIVLYHGNKDKNMVPKFGFGKSDTDYGIGFYTTPDKELAKEWAWSGYTKGTHGYVHSYKYDMSGLNVLDLTKISPLHWIAELLYNRKIDVDEPFLGEDNSWRRQEIIKRYKIDTNKYDLILGYRADDSYFRYAADFVSNSLSLENLQSAMRFGLLGLQVALKSKRAFDEILKSEHVIEEVPSEYKRKFDKRDKAARDEYNQLIRTSRQHKSNKHTYIATILED